MVTIIMHTSTLYEHIIIRRGEVYKDEARAFYFYIQNSVSPKVIENLKQI